MNLEKCTIDDIRDENARKHFIDLMKSEGLASVGYYALFYAVFSCIIFYLGMLIPYYTNERYGSGGIIIIEGSLFFGICMGMMSLAMGVFLIHDKIYRIKITDESHPSSVKNWMIANKFNKQELDENVFALKPDFKLRVFNTIMFTIEDGYAIILAPHTRLKDFAKVFK